MADLWKIQVLTLDFLLEGRISSDMMVSGVTWTDPYILEAYYHHFGFDNTVPIVSLTETQFQPTGNLAIPADAGNNWAINGDRAVAFIPRDEASTAYLLKKNKLKSLVPADIYIGPYLIHGKVRSPDKPESGLKFITQCSRLVMQDVTIDLQLPGAKFHGLEAPYAVLCLFYLQCAAIRA